MDLKFIFEYKPLYTRHTHTHSPHIQRNSREERVDREKISRKMQHTSLYIYQPLPRKKNHHLLLFVMEKIKNTAKITFYQQKSVCKTFQNPCNARNDYTKLKKSGITRLSLSEKRARERVNNCNTFPQNSRMINALKDYLACCLASVKLMRSR